MVKEVRATLVMNRCGRYLRFDQLDPPTVHDLVLRRRSDGHRPAVVMRDAKTHSPESPICPTILRWREGWPELSNGERPIERHDAQHRRGVTGH